MPYDSSEDDKMFPATFFTQLNAKAFSDSLLKESLISEVLQGLNVPATPGAPLRFIHIYVFTSMFKALEN